jgi:hypothetical protein
MPLDPLAIAAFGLVLSSQGVIWYKLGRIEAKMTAHKRAHEEAISHGHESTAPRRRTQQDGPTC